MIEVVLTNILVQGGVIYITIKESIYLRVNNPTLNQNTGKYNLNHIWDWVLFKTPGPKLGSSQHPAAIQ